MNAKRRVLIVHGSDETREVLKTALQRRGLEIFEATVTAEALALAKRHRPEVIVVDLDCDGDGDPAAEDAACERFNAESLSTNASLVVLGSLRLCKAARQRLNRPGIPSAEGEYVTKPYHYAPLIRRIEELAGTPRLAATG